MNMRYPDDWFMPLVKDIQEARVAAEALMDWLEESKPVLFEEYESESG